MSLLDKIISKLRLSRVKWHDFRNVEPVSRKFGFDRGTPIDRYYMRKFLAQNSSNIRGVVLEVAESKFSKEFDNGVTSFEVLHVEQTAGATIIGDLTRLETLPKEKMDCFICTQVFNFIFDFEKAIEGAYHLVKPGGVVLATVSGISQISRFDADRWGHFWSFYPQGIQRAFEKVFGVGNVSVQAYGNSLSAIAFLKGLSHDELSQHELDYFDQDYPVCISITARKVS